MYSLIIQHNSLITINVCICVYTHLHRDTMSVHIDLCDIFHKKIGQGSYRCKCLFYWWSWLGVSDLFYTSLKHLFCKMTIWDLVIPLIPGQSVKQKHCFRLGQGQVSCKEWAVIWYSLQEKKMKSIIHLKQCDASVLFYWKCTSSNSVSRDFKKSVKDDCELCVVIAVMSMPQNSSIMENGL